MGSSFPRLGEFFRIEVKSMNFGADESKAHFDELNEYLGPHDLLLVILWKWQNYDEHHVYPLIVDSYLGNAIDIAEFRDQLHLARGGFFVDRQDCPDGCAPDSCSHHGEPLNASGKRERVTGPLSRRVSQKVSFAANFGGLVRMVKTRSPEAAMVLRRIRYRNSAAHGYTCFIHRNFLNEERNQYNNSEWTKFARSYGIDTRNRQLDEIISQIQALDPNYREKLRIYFRE